MSRRPHQTLRLPLRVDNEKALGRTAVRPYVSPVKLAESNLYHYLPTAPAIFDQTQANQPALCYDFQSHHGRTGMFSKIHHAGYHVEDIDAAVAWYEKTLRRRADGRRHCRRWKAGIRTHGERGGGAHRAR